MKGGYAMQKLKGFWIPAEILLNKDLSDKEKIILSMILYLSEEKGNCFASNKYIASIVNVTPERVSKIIRSLKDKGYVKVKLKYKIDSKEIEERQITPIVENINDLLSDECHHCCYYYSLEIARIIKDSILIWGAIEEPFEDGHNYYAHAVILRNGYIYDSNMRQSEKYEDFTKLYKFKLYKQ